MIHTCPVFWLQGPAPPSSYILYTPVIIVIIHAKPYKIWPTGPVMGEDTPSTSPTMGQVALTHPTYGITYQHYWLHCSNALCKLSRTLDHSGCETWSTQWQAPTMDWSSHTVHQSGTAEPRPDRIQEELPHMRVSVPACSDTGASHGMSEGSVLPPLQLNMSQTDCSLCQRMHFPEKWRREDSFSRF